jgi:hypothetical protein
MEWVVWVAWVAWVVWVEWEWVDRENNSRKLWSIWIALDLLLIHFVK